MQKATLFLTIIMVVSLFTTESKAQNPNIITTYAGTTGSGYSGNGVPANTTKLNYPQGVAIDASGNIYIADQNNFRIRKINQLGIITNYAGNGASGFSGDGGLATNASLGSTKTIAIDNVGNLYIAASGDTMGFNRIRKVTPAGIISTFAGTGTSGFSGDGGMATAAKLYYAYGVATDASGNVYIADAHNNRIRKVNSSGVISTIAGTGVAGFSGDGGPATAAQISFSSDLAVDASGNIYLSDPNNKRVRKINPSGIISTVAGNGTTGYSGDGGPAISAQLGFPQGLSTDVMGNLYIADKTNNVIRMVNSSGIITTFAGTGLAGFMGDGGTAITSRLNQPYELAINNATGKVFISDMNNSRIREVSHSPSITKDSFCVYLENMCSGIQVEFVSKTYSAGQHVKTYFGNSLSTDAPTVAYGTNGIYSYFEALASSGTYTIKHVLYDGATPVDSLVYPWQFSACENLSIRYFYDANNNCIKDSGESYIFQSIRTEIDLNSVSVDTLSSTSGFNYLAYGVANDIYSFKVLSAPAGLGATCPIVKDTFYTGTHITKNIGLSCSSGSLDFGIHTVIPVTGMHDQWGDIYVNNASCYGPTAVVTLSFSPKYSADGGWDMYPTPTTISGNTVTWEITGLNNHTTTPIDLYYAIWSNPATGYLVAGDTVQSYITITPTTGDIDTTNNTQIVIDTVRASCDPNEMMVSPNGCIPSSFSPTQLHYTIMFQNTGTDTAFNIYVMDTLSDYVDISTMNIVSASAEMYVSKLKTSTGQNVLKFDFPGINLLDSSHHSACTGTVLFDINTKSGLPDNTPVNNQAGIYFDYNSVVMTNSVATIKGCPSGVEMLLNPQKIFIYPNPVTNELTISSSKQISEIAISNLLGKIVYYNNFDTDKAVIGVSQLPSGIYFIKINGIEVRKFIKQ